MNVYEIELTLTARQTRKVTTVTRVEHAYGVMDAVQQALMNAGVDANLGGQDVAFVHVGPPREAIEKYDRFARAEVARAVDAEVTRAMDTVGTTTFGQRNE